MSERRFRIPEKLQKGTTDRPSPMVLYDYTTVPVPENLGKKIPAPVKKKRA